MSIALFLYITKYKLMNNQKEIDRKNLIMKRLDFLWETRKIVKKHLLERHKIV